MLTCASLWGRGFMPCCIDDGGYLFSGIRLAEPSVQSSALPSQQQLGALIFQSPIPIVHDRLCEGPACVAHLSAYGRYAGNAIGGKPGGMQTGNEPGLYMVKAKAIFCSTGRHAAHSASCPGAHAEGNWTRSLAIVMLLMLFG